MNTVARRTWMGSLLLTLPLWADAPTLSLMSNEHANRLYQQLIARHWVPRTGLFLSFTDVDDRKLTQQASTYEQGAMGLLAIHVGDRPRAEALLRFLQDAWKANGLRAEPRRGIQGLTNFYNAEFGGEGIEKTIHVGPNAWAALFAARFGNRFKSTNATAWALEVAEWIRKSVPHRAGGVAMSPLAGTDGIPWPEVFSVENNLSYYALLSELLKAKTLSATDRDALDKERSGVLNWILTTGFDPKNYAMNRGVNPKGVDSIRALDTHTWLVSGVGPAVLRKKQIDPDRIMKGIERDFIVTVQGRVGTDPADKKESIRIAALSEKDSAGAAPRNPATGGRMIWYEGLGQTLIALDVLMNDALQRNDVTRVAEYRKKLERWTVDFDAASLPRFPKGTAYAYGTAGKLFVDGWWSPPEGAVGAPASLITSIWRLFVGLGINPLTGDTSKLVQPVSVQWKNLPTPARPQPSVLFGASEDMVSRAWRLLEDGREAQALEQAEATIVEWSSFAEELQSEKMRAHGGILPYNGAPEERDNIFSYWALNDVGTAYFILGKIQDSRGNLTLAKQAFGQILKKFSLAQVWDPKGWFWVPADAIRNEFMKRRPEAYFDLLPENTSSLEGKKAF